MKKIIPFIAFFVLFEFTACKEKAEAKSIEADGITKWKIAKSDNIQFQYPGNWYLTSDKSKGVTWFRLSEDTGTATVFFPLEIWEFPLSTGSFEKFSKNVTYEFFIHSTDGKNGSLLSIEPSTFKNFQGDTFEYTKNGYPVEIITVNGINKYYMLVNFRNKLTDNIATNIFNSIIISK